jgi:hypothetical protein
MEKLLPARTAVLTLNELPMLMKFNTDAVCPTRAKERIDMVDPTLTYCITDIPPPILTPALKLTEEPSLAYDNTDKFPPRRVLALTDNEEPRFNLSQVLIL